MAFAVSLQAQLYPDRHTTSTVDGWKSCTAAQNPNPGLGIGHWLQFDLLSPRQVTTLKLWNHNDPANLDDGVQIINIQTSLDKTNWTDLGDFAVTQSTGSAFYEGEDVANFNGQLMRFVIITAVSNYGGTCYGFDEARFYLGQPVPVELANFEGTCKDGKKDISWEFADITDFSIVELEWSDSGKDWQKIYSTNNPGTKTSAGIFVNEYDDNRKINTDLNFYRLKMIDLDGDIQYSPIINVSCEFDENDVQIFPNPVSKSLNIDVELVKDSKITYQVQDLLGQTVMQGYMDGSEGNNRITMEAVELINGTYILSVQAGSVNVEKKFIKLSN